MSKHVMIDIETLGTKPGSVIVSIAAVPFEEHYLTLSRDGQFFTRVNLERSLELGFKVDADTLKWWMRQDKDAIEASFLGEDSLVSEALWDLSDYLKKLGDDVRVWGYGANFDIVLLETYFDRMGIPRPWSYRNIRCARTLTRLSGVRLEKPAGMIAHHPTDDCIWQIRELQASLKNLGLSLDHEEVAHV